MSETHEDANNSQAAEDEERQRRRIAKRRRARLKWLLLLPVLAGAAFLYWRSQQPPDVEVVTPQKRSAVEALTASGRVEGAREVQLSADRAGILVDTLVREGDHVATGDVVARMSAEVESAELRQAEAAIATARANLAEAQAQSRTLSPSIAQAEAEVRGGIEQARERIAAAEARLEELLSGGRAEEVSDAEAAVSHARARLAQAESEVQRARSLASADATARAALERAEAGARDAAARLQQARTRLEQAQRDRDRAARLQAEGVMPLAEFEAAQTAADTAAETVEQAQAVVRQAEVEVENQRTLLEVTREERLERALTEREAAAQQLRQAQARRDLVGSPARDEQIAAQHAELRSARAALTQAAEAGPARIESIRRTPARERVAVAQRRLDEAIATRDAVLTRLQKTEVTARFSGTVTEVTLEPGAVVTPGQPIVVLSEMEWPEVRVEIDERNIAEVSPGLSAYLTADSYPDRAIEAMVDRIAPRTITERGIVDVVLRPVHRPEWLRSGMTVDASIIVEKARERLVLPTRAVERGAAQDSVLVVEDGEVKRLTIETGVGGVRGVIIRSGLPEDALVVLEPTAVEVGQRVVPIEVESEVAAGDV